MWSISTRSKDINMQKWTPYRKQIQHSLHLNSLSIRYVAALLWERKRKTEMEEKEEWWIEMGEEDEHQYWSAQVFLAHIFVLFFLLNPRQHNLEKVYTLPDTTMIGRDEPALPLHEIVRRLENTYCSSIGVEYMHIDKDEKCELGIRKCQCMTLCEGCWIWV